MSKNTPEKESKKQIDVTAQITYTSDNPIVTGTLVDVPLYNKSTGQTALFLQKDGESGGKVFDLELNSSETIPYGLSELRSMYSDNGGDTGQILDGMKTYIRDNVSSPTAIPLFMGNLLLDFGTDVYDMTRTHKNTGDSAQEILQNVLSLKDGERLSGFVCTNIHEFGMRLLHECDIEAAVISGKKKDEGSHAALIYKSGEGKYIFTDYGLVQEIEAPSIKEAIYIINKESMDLFSHGSIAIIDENSSYHEFALQDEAVWGEAIDKRAYNDKSLFEHNVSNNSGISANVDISSQGNISAEIEGTYAFGDSDARRNLSLGVGYRKSGETASFDSSESLGIKAGFSGINEGEKSNFFFQTTLGADYTTGSVHDRYVKTSQYSDQSYYDSVNQVADEIRAMGYTDGEIQNATEQLMSAHKNFSVPAGPDKKNNYLTMFTRGVAGVESTVLDNERTTITNVGQVSFTGNVTFGTNGTTSKTGDYRFALEDGVQMQNQLGKTTLNNNISGGVLIDNRETLGAQNMSVEIGAKFNAGSSFYTQPTENLAFGAGVSGYAVLTQPSTDYGFRASASATYRPKGSDITFTGTAGVTADYQRLHIGGFSEQTENKHSFSASIGAQYKNNKFNLGFKKDINNINHTRDKTHFYLGYTRNF